jgi:hypothetical protein
MHADGVGVPVDVLLQAAEERDEQQIAQRAQVNGVLREEVLDVEDERCLPAPGQPVRGQAECERRRVDEDCVLPAQAARGAIERQREIELPSRGASARRCGWRRCVRG